MCYVLRRFAKADYRMSDMAILLAGALAREEQDVRELVGQLYPVVRTRVWRVLRRSGRARGRTAETEMEDLVQDTFTLLFDDNGKVLRSWDPSRGLALPAFVGLVAERNAVSIMRSGRRNPWTEDPTLDGDIVVESAAPDLERSTASREMLSTLLDRLRERLSPLGMHLFELLYVDEQSVEQVQTLTGLSADAVYAWRSRLRKLVSTIMDELRTPVPLPIHSSKGAVA